jgi:hypothetical protein
VWLTSLLPLALFLAGYATPMPISQLSAGNVCILHSTHPHTHITNIPASPGSRSHAIPLTQEYLYPRSPRRPSASSTRKTKRASSVQHRLAGLSTLRDALKNPTFPPGFYSAEDRNVEETIEDWIQEQKRLAVDGGDHDTDSGRSQSFWAKVLLVLLAKIVSLGMVLILAVLMLVL